MKTIFIDRDGCVNVRLVGNWVMTWDDFEFMPGAISGIAALKKAGYRLILVTNQRCINLGKFSEEKLDALHDKMQNELKNEGGFFDSIYHCPHDRDENCGCRKPQPGMLLKAAEDFGDIDLSKSIMLGDQESDRLASEAAGVGSFYQISSEQTIADAAKIILTP